MQPVLVVGHSSAHAVAKSRKGRNEGVKAIWAGGRRKGGDKVEKGASCVGPTTCGEQLPAWCCMCAGFARGERAAGRKFGRRAVSKHFPFCNV